MTDREGWYYRALEALKTHFRAGEKTGEELSDMLLDHGVEPARNQFVFGSVIRQLVMDKVIVKTGERRPMKHKASHGRSTDVYRRVRKAS